MANKLVYGLIATFAGLAFMVVPARATVVNMGFDQLQTDPPTGAQYVHDFYNGGCGTAARGGATSCDGPDYGVSWENAFAQSPYTASHQPSKPNIIVNHSPDIYAPYVTTTMNVAAGFDHRLSFYYSNHSATTVIGLFSGLDGTGDVLAAVVAPPTAKGYECTNGSGFGGYYGCWNPASIAFDGIARSATFLTYPDHLGLDSIRINVLPEPSEFAMFALGMLLIGGLVALRKRKTLPDSLDT